MLSKEALQGHKRIKINGEKFVIRRINPFVDIPADKMPQMFTTMAPSKRPPAPEKKDPGADLAAFNRAQEDMKVVVAAGLIQPQLLPVGKGESRGSEPGITVDDIFRDPLLGAKLYAEILFHSMNRFRGLSGVFFSIKQRLLLSMLLRKTMASARAQLFSPTPSAAQ